MSAVVRIMPPTMNDEVVTPLGRGVYQGTILSHPEAEFPSLLGEVSYDPKRSGEWVREDPAWKGFWVKKLHPLEEIKPYRK